MKCESLAQCVRQTIISGADSREAIHTPGGSVLEDRREPGGRAGSLSAVSRYAVCAMRLERPEKEAALPYVQPISPSCDRLLAVAARLLGFTAASGYPRRLMLTISCTDPAPVNPCSRVAPRVVWRLEGPR